jgi:hypothetical protein
MYNKCKIVTLQLIFIVEEICFAFGSSPRYCLRCRAFVGGNRRRALTAGLDDDNAMKDKAVVSAARSII